MEELSKLGTLGIELEEINLGIDLKYEGMLNSLKNKLLVVRKYFENLLDDVLKDLTEKIVGEKQQNLGNLKELEEKLNRAMNDYLEKKDNSQRDLAAFYELFTFMKEFTEESYSLILSKPIDIDVNFLKNDLNDFIGKHLNRVFEPPKAFLTELYRFFQGSQDLYEFEEDITYGKAFNLEESFPSNVSIIAKSHSFEPFTENDSKSPIIQVMDNKYWVTANRDKFSIYFYSWGPPSGDNLQHRPKMSRFGGGKQKIEKGLQHQILFTSTRIEDFNSAVKNPGFHCACYMKNKEATSLLLFGGNHNVRS